MAMSYPSLRLGEFVKEQLEKRGTSISKEFIERSLYILGVPVARCGCMSLPSGKVDKRQLVQGRWYCRPL